MFPHERGPFPSFRRRPQAYFNSTQAAKREATTDEEGIKKSIWETPQATDTTQQPPLNITQARKTESGRGKELCIRRRGSQGGSNTREREARRECTIAEPIALVCCRTMSTTCAPVMRTKLASNRTTSAPPTWTVNLDPALATSVRLRCSPT